jgi:hypothetical protein
MIQPNSPREFPQVDIFLASQARRFYGLDVLVTTAPDRLHIIQRALTLVTDLEAPARLWVERLDPRKAVDIGKKALAMPILLPGTTNEAQDPAVVEAQPPRTVGALRAFQNPAVHDIVIDRYRDMGDPPGHIVSYLSIWPDSLTHLPPEFDIKGAQSTFAAVMFGIHGELFVDAIQTVVTTVGSEREITFDTAA